MHYKHNQRVIEHTLPQYSSRQGTAPSMTMTRTVHQSNLSPHPRRVHERGPHTQSFDNFLSITETLLHFNNFSCFLTPNTPPPQRSSKNNWKATIKRKKKKVGQIWH